MLSSKVQHLTLARNAFEDQSFGFSLTDEHFSQFLTMDLSSIAFWEIALPEVSDQLVSKLVTSCKECEIIEFHESSGGISHYGLGFQKLSAIFDEMQNQTKLKAFKLCSVAEDRYRYSPDV